MNPVISTVPLRAVSRTRTKASDAWMEIDKQTDGLRALLKREEEQKTNRGGEKLEESSLPQRDGAAGEEGGESTDHEERAGDERGVRVERNSRERTGESAFIIHRERES